LDLLGEDREIFLKGRRAENQGMGIGAFGYYRRVVENQKTRLIDQIIQVANRIGAGQEILTSLEEAKGTWQFSKSLDVLKVKLPEQLMIRGQNPLLLLHGALSGGLHNGSDEKCLELATSIRVLLSELAERIAQALSDEEELKQSVLKLLEAGQESGKA
jgi:hypothetical protein